MNGKWFLFVVCLVLALLVVWPFFNFDHFQVEGTYCNPDDSAVPSRCVMMGFEAHSIVAIAFPVCREYYVINDNIGEVEHPIEGIYYLQEGSCKMVRYYG